MAKTRTEVSIASVGKALSRALGLLARRAYTEAELKKKLKAYPEPEVEEAIRKLKDWGYLDDRAYAERYVSARKDRYGPYRLRQELRRRGVEEALLDELVTEKGEAEAAYALLFRHRNRYRGEKARAVRFLLSRGFSLEAALLAFDRLQNEEPEG